MSKLNNKTTEAPYPTGKHGGLQQLNKIAVGFLLLANALGTVHAGVVSVPTPECYASFDADAAGEHITDPAYSIAASPGDPALPFREINVIVPPNAEIASVSAELKNAPTVIVGGTHDVAPAPPPVTVVDGKVTYDWGQGKQIEFGRNILVYGKNEFYPANNVEVVEVGNMRKWRIAKIRYYPYRYNPISGQLAFTSGGEIAVFYAVNSLAVASAQALSDTVFSSKVRKLTANYAEALNWYTSPPPSAGAPTVQSIQSTTSYLILTTSGVVNGSAKLQQFINHKINRGFSVGAVTESQWGGGTGDAAADHIRAYLAAHYITDGIQYVLLIGNPNPASGDVPMKMLWPRHNMDTYNEAPSDYFYADLTGNWDRDGDGYFGEQDDDFGPGGVDRYPEVVVGRIPFYGSFADLDSILQKTIDYESGAIGGAWVRTVLLSAKPSDASTPGYHLCEAIRTDAAGPVGFDTTRVYDDDYGLNPPPDYTPCTYSNVLAAWQQHAGFHFWWTHGNQTVASDIFTSAQTQYLDDQYPSFTFQVSCLNGYPENSNNLGYALLKRGAITTDSATRVSWYYPGQTTFSNSDSNAGLAYTYALKLIRDHLPCGDAHFEMMTDVPNGIWMNHCVFNLYGDPSLAYAAGPAVAHTPLTDTDITSAPYTVEADISSNGPLAAGSPVIKWNTTGGSVFNSAPMALVGGITYRGQIPAQPLGTTIYYYIQATDTTGRVSTSPAGAPSSLHSFRVRPDMFPPLIQHTPLANTGDTTGPYSVQALVTDDLGVGSVTLYYNKNGGADIPLPMLGQGADVYEAQIPGPTSAGDVISYFIVAADLSVDQNTARSPAGSGYYCFGISERIRVAVHNCSAVPTYFVGGNSNAYAQIADVLSSDPAQRLDVTVVTSLAPNDLSGKDVLVLPDNAVLNADLGSVADWFGAGKVIVTLDSGTCYGAYTGWMWPAAVGTTGRGYYWDYNSDLYQQIWVADPVTSGYSVGQVIESRVYEAQFYTNNLPPDARALAGSQSDPGRCYAAYRDVPGRGRFVVLGPYVYLCQTQYSMIRNAVIPASSDRQIRVTAPAGGETYDAGQIVTVSYQTSGSWMGADTISLEYCTGLDSAWHQIPGAESLIYSVGTFHWNTSGLPGSHNYKIRASLVEGSLFDESDAPFSIVRNLDIAEAKSVSDGEVVKLAGKVVTCSTGLYNYIQEPDRRAGIRLYTPQVLTPSSTIDAVGVMSTAGGERALNAEAVLAVGVAPDIGPIAMTTRCVGGGAFGLQQAVMEYRLVLEGSVWTRQFLPAVGLNNIGLLVTLFGRVTAFGPDYFYIDDGAECDDGSGLIGVRVICGSLTRPDVSQRVVVTGISSTYFDRGSMFRALVLPSQEDLQILP